MDEPTVWMKLTVSAPEPVLLAMASLLVDWGAAGVIESPGEVTAYYVPPSREEVETRLRRYAADLAEAVRWSWEADVGEVWRDGWKRHFHALQVSSRLGVCPSWEEWVPEDPRVRVIRMDPGQAFGTGAHETTRICLRLIDEELRASVPDSFLDVGCGSGILSIAARLLGVPRVTAVDLDPLATGATLQNARRNGVDRGLQIVRGDLRAIRADYPLVAANILFQVLLGLAPILAARVARGGKLVLSGMLQKELRPAETVYGRLGLAPVRTETDGEWGALVLGRG